MKKAILRHDNAGEFILVDEEGNFVMDIDAGNMEDDIDWDLVEQQANENGYTLD